MVKQGRHGNAWMLGAGAAILLGGIGIGLAIPSAIEAVADQRTAVPNLASAEASTSLQIAASEGNWVVRETIDPMSDRKSMSATLASAGSGKAARLSVSCSQPSTSLWLTLHYNDYLGSDDGIDGFKTFWTRSGRAESRQVMFALRNDQTSVEVYKDVDAMIAEISSEARFVVTTQPYNSDYVTVEFLTTGARAALERLQQGCSLENPL